MSPVLYAGVLPLPQTGVFLPRQGVLASSIRESVLSLSFHSLPEHLLCFILVPASRILRQAISNQRILTWGLIAFQHRGHIEEVSTET